MLSVACLSIIPPVVTSLSAYLNSAYTRLIASNRFSINNVRTVQQKGGAEKTTFQRKAKMRALPADPKLQALKFDSRARIKFI